jgi:hypothetical protein
MTIEQQVADVINNRLQDLGTVVASVDVDSASAEFATASIVLQIQEMPAGSSATVLNQTAVLAISKLNELQEGSEWCTLTDVSLGPIAGTSMTMNTKFAIKNPGGNDDNPS